jgi:hypothetical protein
MLAISMIWESTVALIDFSVWLIFEVILGAEIESSATNPSGVRITTLAFLNLFISVLVGIGGC